MSWIIVLLIVAFFVWRMKPAKGIRTMSTTEVKALTKDKSKQFVDVRTPGEYKGRHVKEFKNIPLNDLGKRMSELDKDKETYVICQSGMRSARAAGMLKKAGFSDVINVKGGMSAWQ
ncbi:rhodanese-like domain-containing protein [Sporosarcina gallistercoris]|uniref:Rhodanese-like domain-containing protein n=1 Tax=Sporosarcina gallistercoris TaxID=2762245 RepID=A0ABR8PHP2_9BACL|nr:rhodanese-like domain-containing protein [Sporosarcina gallistercoris]MBD7907690.1 rhodanese-like domain-containing protein [Sporosarcina gallistercoris]